MDILKVINLSFTYPSGKKALDGINFCVKEGEFWGIIGPNGGGKSTLLKCILGLLNAPQGAIALAKTCAYVPQAAGLNPAFATSVMEVTLSGALGAKSFFFTPKSLKQKALAKLELVGMKELASRNIFELSGGQIQRVLIARALMKDAGILLLDEPTANIDIAGQIEVFALLKNLAAEGIAVLCVCHDLALVSAFAPRALHVCGRAHLHEFCEHERAARLKLLAAGAQGFCQLELLEQICQLPHEHEDGAREGGGAGAAGGGGAEVAGGGGAEVAGGGGAVAAKTPTPETAAATAGQSPVFSHFLPTPSENPVFSHFLPTPETAEPTPETAAATAGENHVFSQISASQQSANFTPSGLNFTKISGKNVKFTKENL